MTDHKNIRIPELGEVEKKFHNYHQDEINFLRELNNGLLGDLKSDKKNCILKLEEQVRKNERLTQEKKELEIELVRHKDLTKRLSKVLYMVSILMAIGGCLSNVFAENEFLFTLGVILIGFGGLYGIISPYKEKHTLDLRKNQVP